MTTSVTVNPVRSSYMRRIASSSSRTAFSLSAAWSCVSSCARRNASSSNACLASASLLVREETESVINDTPSFSRCTSLDESASGSAGRCDSPWRSISRNRCSACSARFFQAASDSRVSAVRTPLLTTMPSFACLFPFDERLFTLCDTQLFQPVKLGLDGIALPNRLCKRESHTCSTRSLLWFSY